MPQPHMTMPCKPIQDQLDLFVMAGLPPETQGLIEDHLAQCPDCRQVQTSLVAATEALRSAMTPTQAERQSLKWTHSRAYAAIAEAALHPAVKPIPWRIPLGLAAAAALMILIGGYARVSITPRNTATATASCIPWQQTGILPMLDPDSAYPLVQDKTVLALKPTVDGLHIEAFSKCSGTRLWETPMPALSTPDTKMGWLVTWIRSSRDEASLVALSLKTGTPIKEYARQAAPRTGTLPRPAITESCVYWLEPNHLAAADLASGKRLWTVVTSNSANATLAFNQHHIYLVTRDHCTAYDRESGHPSWTWNTGAAQSVFDGKMLAKTDDHYVLLACRDQAQGRLTCLNATTGQPIWSHSTGAPFNLQIIRGKTYVRSHQIEAFDTATGATLWTQPQEGCSPLTIVDNLIYVAGGAGKDELCALDANSGKLVQRLHLPVSCSGIVIEGRRGVISGRNGILYAVPLMNIHG